MGKLAKKAQRQAAAIAALQSNVQPIIEFQYDDPIFAASCHPSKNLIAIGLATGHVNVYSYDAELLENSLISEQQKQKQKQKSVKKSKNDDETNTTTTIKNKRVWKKISNGLIDEEEATGVKLLWKTRRHKGSCRSLQFDPKGEYLYSVGTDKIIKKANAETGKVVAKVEYESSSAFATKLLLAQNKPTLLCGTEDGDIHIYDTRSMTKTNTIRKVHDDAVNGICAMAGGKSDYQYVSVGSTTLTHFDVRKGIIQQSENQEDEMLSVCFVDPTNTQTPAAASMAEGVVTLWRQDKNDFVDQISRVRISEESVDCIIPALEESGDTVWCGSADGVISKIDTRRGKVLEKRVHFKVGEEEIAGLDLDFDYRLVSFGMERLKIWSNAQSSDSDSESESESEIESESDDSENANDSGSDVDEKSESDSDSNEKSEKSEPESESEEEEEKPVTKKQKTVKKADQITRKQLKNLQQHEHGIRKFEGL